MEVNSSHCVHTLAPKSFRSIKTRQDPAAMAMTESAPVSLRKEMLTCNKYWANYAKRRSSATDFDERRRMAVAAAAAKNYNNECGERAYDSADCYRRGRQDRQEYIEIEKHQ